MASDEDSVMEVAEKMWNSGVTENQVSVLTQMREMASFFEGQVGFIMTMANVSVFKTDDGLVLIDTATSVHAIMVLEQLKKYFNFPETRIHSIIYTHGHVDHVKGTDLYERVQMESGKPSIRVVAHVNVSHRFNRYKTTRGYNTVINRRQFQLDTFEWPEYYRYPDITYENRMEIDVGGVKFILQHGCGETDDATWIYIPRYKAICTGDFFIWATPNCGNPQKVQRYPLEWAAALRSMDLLEAEILLPGHGPPILGAGRVRKALRDTAGFLEQLCEPVMKMINNGDRLDDILKVYKRPDHLMRAPYLKAVYDDPEFIVRNLWRQYAGWWDQDPSSLRPASAVAIGKELLAMSGGTQGLLKRVDVLKSQGDEGLKVAAMLLERACLAQARDPLLQRARADIYRLMEGKEICFMAKNIYYDAADKADRLASKL